jgi:outer membrane protein assembly factor BamA
MAFFRLLSILFLSIPLPVAAQSGAQLAAARAQSVLVKGSRFQSDQIAPITGLRTGQQVTREDIQKGADALAASGLFSKVVYRFDTEPAGVRVEYQVEDATSFPAYFDNLPWFTDADLIAAVKTSVHLFDGKVPQQGSILDDVAGAISRQLVTRGISANVTHEFVTLPGKDWPVVKFHSEAAAPIVQSVEFSDSLATNDHAIQDRLADLVGKPFSRSAVEAFEYEQVRPVYLGHAFLEAKFGEPVATVQGNKVIVRVSIESGRAFTWSGVSWSGNESIPSTELDKLVELNLGGNADGMKIEATWDDLRKAYYRLGFLDLSMSVSPRFDEVAGRATYDVKIKEGPQYHMGNLVLTGLSMEGERRIRSGWKIPVGAVFNQTLYDDFVSTGIKESFAGLPVHYEKIGRFLQKDPAGAKVDVMLDFQ